MSQLNRQLLSINEELYLVKRIVKEENIKDIEPLKTLYQASHVFKRDSMFYFCDKISELEQLQEDSIQETKQEQSI